MNNFEYERSFEVADIMPFIEYCKNNNFELKKITSQNRIVFENKTNKKLVARLTHETAGGKTTIVLDFKNVVEKNDNLNQSIESQPLQIEEKDIPAVLSMLDVIGFLQVADNLRKRYVYEKQNVMFEIDEYIRPKTNVVAIEGEKENVEKIYEKLKENAKK